MPEQITRIVFPGQPFEVNMTSEQAKTLAELFPDTGAGPYAPTHRNVVVQERLPRRKTVGGIIIPDESRDRDQQVMTVARVVAIGPKAWSHPYTDEAEDPQFAVGDFVLVPQYGNHRPKSAKPVNNDSADRPVFRVLDVQYVLSVVTDIHELLR